MDSNNITNKHRQRIVLKQKKKKKLRPRHMALIRSPKAYKLPIINSKRKVLSVESTGKKLELRPCNNKPRINVIKYKHPLIAHRQRCIIPRYVPVYERQGKGRINIVPKWGQR